jgi:hypothetical protein
VNSPAGGKVDLAQEQRRENASEERRGGVHTRIRRPFEWEPCRQI